MISLDWDHPEIEDEAVFRILSANLSPAQLAGRIEARSLDVEAQAFRAVSELEHEIGVVPTAHRFLFE